MKGVDRAAKFFLLTPKCVLQELLLCFNLEHLLFFDAILFLFKPRLRKLKLTDLLQKLSVELSFFDPKDSFDDSHLLGIKKSAKMPEYWLLKL